MIELQVINYLLATGDIAFILHNNIDLEFFSQFKKEFEFILNHLAQYNTIPDSFTFLNTFPDFEIVTVNETKDYLLDNLYKKRNRRRLATTFNQVSKSLNADDVDEAMNIFLNSAAQISESKHIDCVDLIHDISRYDTFIDRNREYEKFFVKTGFPELDMVLGGWDRTEELATIVGRPGSGKSWCLLKSAIAALEQGLNVGFYSGEMSEDIVGYRFDTIISGISNYKISKAKDDIINSYKDFVDSLAGKYTKGSFKVLTPAMIDGPAGVNALRAFIEKEGLDILFVDQHSLLEDDRGAKNPVERASNISRDLKNLQVMKKIPIIAASQQNRSKSEENKGPGTENVAQSDRISQDSTVVLFVEQDREDQTMKLNLVKSRSSASGKEITYKIDLDKGRFLYIPEDDNAVDGAGTEELKEEYEIDYF